MQLQQENAQLRNDSKNTSMEIWLLKNQLNNETKCSTFNNSSSVHNPQLDQLHIAANMTQGNTTITTLNSNI